MSGMLQRDEVEKLLGESVLMMDPQTLLTYCQEHHKRRFGIAIALEGAKELGCLKWMKKVYGPSAGEILKWIWTENNGRLRGQPFSFSMCSSGWKFAHDEARVKVMELKKTEATRPEVEKGFASGASFIKRS